MLKRVCRLPPRRSALLLGPRQTGKSTLVRSLLPGRSWSVDLLQHDAFLRYSKEPARFRREVEAQVRAGTRVVFVDEIQRVPALLEEIHGLIEAHRVRFLLTGSSARKLRRGAANLLAGRAATRRLHPLTLAEQGGRFDLERTLRYGSLPAVVTGSERDARDLLASYAETYLREEVQAEAVVRNLGGFARFLDIVAAESGGIVNASAVARDAALAPRTVQEYYQILEDTLIGYRLEPWRHSPRARLVGHPRFYLFDTGVTNALARRLGAPPDPVSRGRLFEQWVVLECARLLDYRRVRGPPLLLEDAQRRGGRSPRRAPRPPAPGRGDQGQTDGGGGRSLGAPVVRRGPPARAKARGGRGGRAVPARRSRRPAVPLVLRSTASDDPVAPRSVPRTRATLSAMTSWRRAGPRLVVSLLAAVLCADVTLDAACDPIALPGPAAAAAVSPDEPGGADACADFCVPDCFCCSRSETAGPELVLPALTALEQVPYASPEAVPVVVRPVPQPPPLALS